MCTDMKEQEWFDEVVEQRRRVCGLSGLRSRGRLAPLYHISWVRGSTGCGVSIWVCSFSCAQRWAKHAVTECQC